MCGLGGLIGLDSLGIIFQSLYSGRLSDCLENDLVAAWGVSAGAYYGKFCVMGNYEFVLWRYLVMDRCC